MDKERLDYLLDYASKLQGLQSIFDVHLHKEINEVVNEIRSELGFEQSNENVLDEFHIDKHDDMKVIINAHSNQSFETYSGPLHVVIMRK